MSAISRELHDDLDGDLDAIVGRLTTVESWRRLTQGQRDTILEARDRAEIALERLDKSSILAEPTKPPPGPSGEPAPRGDLPGWRQVFLDDFVDGNVPSFGTCDRNSRICSGLPEPYRSRWYAYPDYYPDTRQQHGGDGGYYNPAQMEISGSCLVLKLSRKDGRTSGAAPIPKLPGGAATYGRWAIRYRAEASSVFKIAWLHWRTSSSWGEIDFPEGDLDGNISAFNHHSSGQYAKSTSVPVAGAWHTCVTEWKPGSVAFFLDGNKIGEDTGSGVPSTPMNWIIQSETVLGGAIPANEPVRRIEIDWVAYWVPA